jgi:hypothetical protein
MVVFLSGLLVILGPEGVLPDGQGNGSPYRAIFLLAGLVGLTVVVCVLGFAIAQITALRTFYRARALARVAVVAGTGSSR